MKTDLQLAAAQVRSAETDAKKITDAERAAWSTYGVHTAEDRLAIVA